METAFDVDTGSYKCDLSRYGLHDKSRFPMTAIFLVPGAFVSHPQQPDWGLGQVQSVIGDRVTVNFEHQGKVVINAAKVELEAEFP